MNKPQSYRELVDRFGNPVDFGQTDISKNKFEQNFMTQWRSNLFIGNNVPLTWPEDAPFKNIYVNRELIPVLDKAFYLLLTRDLFKEIKSYDGCWNVRLIRGSSDRWSIHSFGLAIDLNAGLMPLNSDNKWSDEFVDTMKESGFTFGGDFKRLDPMHFQWANNC